MKTLEEMMRDFAQMCGETSCSHCKYKGITKTIGECGVAYAFEQLANPRVGEYATADKTEAVQLPAWCKVGQWVMDGDTMLWKITGFNKDLINAISADKESGCVCHWRELKPVRFRPYTYEEAKGLIGKYIHVEYPRGIVVDRIITCVQKCSTGDMVISGWEQDALLEYNATIDGVPIGVPVIDEEAMKEVK